MAQYVRLDLALVWRSGVKAHNVPSDKGSETSPEPRFHFFFGQFSFGYVRATFPAEMLQAVLRPIYTLTVTCPLSKCSIPLDFLV